MHITSFENDLFASFCVWMCVLAHIYILCLHTWLRLNHASLPACWSFHFSLSLSAFTLVRFPKQNTKKVSIKISIKKWFYFVNACRYDGFIICKKNVTQSDTFGCKLWRVYKLKMTFLVLLSCTLTAYVIALLLDFFSGLRSTYFLYIINEASRLLQYV